MIRNKKNSKRNDYKNSRDLNNKPKIIYTYQFKVNYSNTLLNYLYEKIKDSRNNVKHLLSDHKVLVNGTVITKFDYPLAKDDEVKIAKSPVRENTKKKKEEALKLPKIEIIYEDEYFIAINKPAGLLSVQSDNEVNSAYTLVFNYLKNIDIKLRPYVLHRIDKETSGVLVFAKDIKIHSMLKGHWNDDIKTREYYAIINGTLNNEEGTIKNYLKENKNNLMYVSSNPKDGKLAITNYKVVKHSKEYSMLQVLIDTGRKNQIRVAFSNIDHPIIGDDKYGDSASPIGRLGLHASKLEFINPITNELISIKAPMPKEFNSLFKL